MFPVSLICKKQVYAINLILHARNKSKTHWAKLRRKTGPKYKALNHFDEFYGSVFGTNWQAMREALFRRSKYVAVVNNYGDADETTEYLAKRGAHCLKELFAVQEQFNNEYAPKVEGQQIPHQETNISKLEQYVERVQSEDISSVYPQSGERPEKLELTDISLHDKKTKEIKESESSKNLEDLHMLGSRIIDPSMGISSDILYQYVPATKLKGMDDWVPESLHYAYYSKGKDFPLLIEPETGFKFPEHLKVYTYEMDSEWIMFPEPKRCTTGVFNYYPMDCGSVLSVLALCLSPGDRVLDLCSAPGGKALVALQTLLPDIVVCNDSSISRANRLERMFADYLFDFKTSNKWQERVLISKMDARILQDDLGFDKVLVDVPCTTDRLTVNEDENNIFRPDRVKERLRLPELQSQLLVAALRLVRVGGAVVYSTCTLSPIQNDGVVHMGLKMAFEDHNILATVKDLSGCFGGFSSTLQLAKDDCAPQYGQLVLPSLAANFGPSYVARLVRVK